MADEIVPCKSGIYKLENLTNGKCYVGSTNDFRKRFVFHKSLLARRTHHSIKLQRAWDKNGGDKFAFIILELVENHALLFEREQYWIDALKAAHKDIGYNVAPQAGGSRGLKQSPETIEKRAAKLRGRVRSQEAKDKISVANTGKVRTPEMRIKIGLAGKGRKHTDEARRRISEGHKGIKMPREGVEKSIASRRGYVTSDETKRKQSLAKLGKKQLPEVVMRRSEALRVKYSSPGYVHPLTGITKPPISAETRDRQRIAAVAREARKREAKQQEQQCQS